MALQGKFQKRLSLTDLTFIGLGSIFGSGWLFAASHVSSIAGPAGIVSWVVGGVAVLLLGLVYCELGAALPRAGGVVRYPEYSHGSLLGWMMGFITLIAFSSLIAIEVEACRQYAAAWFPSLNQAGSTHPSVAGWLLQFALLVVFFLLNYFSVKTFAMANNIVSVFKFLVPVLVINHGWSYWVVVPLALGMRDMARAAIGDVVQLFVDANGARPDRLDVHIRAGRIAKVASRVTVADGPPPTEVQLDGRWLCPGLMNAHTQPTADAAKAFVSLVPDERRDKANGLVGTITGLSFAITCPGGEEVTPNVCEGAECSSDADCEAGVDALARVIETLAS